jgi:LCP family protein required for cell wall assembly
VRNGILLALALAVGYGGAEAWAVKSSWDAVGRVATTPAAGHVAATAGHNTLMVGSDARSDLTPAQREALGTGTAEGARTDTIMVLHTGSGDPTLLSIPRDSYVEIPGHGMNKINAAFSIGGAPLLAETVEKATGLRIDGYVEIGFGGFAHLVDAVGGVRMCLPAPINDEKAHIDLPAGCQILDGKNALGYVRMRYSDPEGDLGRVKRQRQFLSALMGKVATPGTVLLPWALHSVGTSAASAVAVGQEDTISETASAFLGLRTISQGKGHSVTVPVANAGLQTPAGLAVEWDAAAASQLFEQLRSDSALTTPSPTPGT